MKKSPLNGLVFLVGLVFFASVVVAGSVAAQSSVAVTTYHYDNLRTGWNNQETTLTPANVNQTTFGILFTVKVDDQVDAQPLVVPNQTIAGPTPGTYQVVYVATENNTIYAFNAANGAVLLSRNLGPPVRWPLACMNNGPHVGISSTPVIDLAAQTLYVISYENGPPPVPTYQLHALNLSDLTDKVAPVTVAASHTLVSGAVFTFNGLYQRQRPALLEANGNIYAGFGSFCDLYGGLSRGWLLGWNTGSLLPLAANQLNDTQATSPTNIFLSSIWMAGYGIAASGANLYFTTANSDCNFYVSPEVCSPATTYDGITDIQESVVELSGDLTELLSIFTPSNVAALDQGDMDLGSGGVLVLPPQSGSIPTLAVTAGKYGRLFLLNGASLGGFTPGGPDQVLDSHDIGGCWCGPSFFTGSDNIGRVVTSQGSSVSTWRVPLSPSPKLVLEGTATITASGQDPGFFTVVSSNGTVANTGIIWAVGRPTPAAPHLVNLYAFQATASSATLNQLFTLPAAGWLNPNSDANIVPVVANGQVYVAGYKEVTVFGILPVPTARIALQPSPIELAMVSPSSPHLLTGKLLAVNGSTLTLQTRAGKSVKIDDALALRNKQVGAPLIVGVPYIVQGSLVDGNGALQATTIVRAKGSSGELWPPDR